MNLLAIDPGTEQSGWCLFGNGAETDVTRFWRVVNCGVMPNDELVYSLAGSPALFGASSLAIEMVASYGMPVGRETFETVRWIGRFQQAWHSPEEVRLVYRRDVKLYLCGSMKAKDANVRQALIDKLGPVGTKAKPGPLYGVKSHAWSALAVAVTAAGA